MERLTGRNEKGDLLLMGDEVYAGEFYEAVSALEEYEDAEEQGRLVRLPCKVGDTVYLIQRKPYRCTGDDRYHCTLPVEKCQNNMGGICMRQSMKIVAPKRFDANDYDFVKKSLKESTYLTYSEAEAALKAGDEPLS